MKRRPVALWLFASAFLVLGMVGVGGVTRLTRSGLSIVEWSPVRGALLPRSDAEWQRAYTAYRASPEGRLVNAHLDVEGFKSIFLVEWFHRLLGRFVGVFFLLPWVYFAARRAITRPEALRYLGWFAAGGAQGALGWFMVKSGLVHHPHVSPYRLTAHLLMALFVLAGLTREALRVAVPREELAPSGVSRGPVHAFLALLVVTLGWGGLMAGHKAGWVSDTFPLMHGALFPAAVWHAVGPAGLVSDSFLVHFTHRTLGVALGCLGVWVFLRARRGVGPQRGAATALLGLVLLQVALGIATVLLHVPIALAVAHQVNGALLLAATVAVSYLQGGRGEKTSA